LARRANLRTLKLNLKLMLIMFDGGDAGFYNDEQDI